ncbi:NUDIX domain-containing protein [Yunchengibacter salinarum]|uniref:NUDIX domain-containing protein n=1 Tax=Yunchengibacter salinarum TaxID=3133399 RepID=UPI0035B66F4C
MPLWQQVKSEKRALESLPMSAKAVVVSRDGKILVLRKSSGLYDLPGGKLEPGEDLFDGLRREILEEIGLSVKRFTFIASWVKTRPGLGDRLMTVYETRLKKRARKLPVALSEEHDWGAFISPRKAARLELQPGYQNAIFLSSMRG